MQKFRKKYGQQLFYLRSFETETYHQKSVNTKYKNGGDLACKNVLLEIREVQLEELIFEA